MSVRTQVDRVKAKVATIRNKFVSLGIAKSTDNIDALATAAESIPKRTSEDLTASGATVTAPAGYYPSGVSTSVQTAGIGLPTLTVDAYDEDNEIGIKATTNQSVGYVSSEKQRTVETFATLTVDGNKVTMECRGAKIERTVGASIATCSIKVKFTTNAGNILTSATTIANGAFSAFKSDTKSGEFTINNVVCGSALSIATSTMCSLYWSGTKTDHRSLYGGTITVPSSAGTYTVEVGMLDD